MSVRWKDLLVGHHRHRPIASHIPFPSIATVYTGKGISGSSNTIYASDPEKPLFAFAICSISFDTSVDVRKLLHNTCGMFKYIPNKRLFVSEPNPAMFGNAGNLATSKYWTNKNWLKSRFHFSFAEYYSPDNTNFGTLRVMNDDLVQPDRGFGTHPHNNMEICTYIVDGNLTHQDSMGTAETLSRGAIQFMTAGTGIRHSEHNLNKTEPLRFIQMWIQPRERNLTPNYGSGIGTFEGRHNKFAHLVSDVQNPVSETPVKINQDVNIFVSEFDAGKDVEFNLKKWSPGVRPLR